MNTQTDRKTRYASAVWEISQTIQNTPSLDDALTYSLKKVADTIEVETGTIWFYDKGQTGSIIPAYILNQTMPSTITLRPGEGIAGAVIENGKSEVILDCQKDPRWAGRVDAKTGFVTKNMICVPLKTKYETIGCIQLINKLKSDTFSEDDLELAENLASLAAIAIDVKGFLVRYDADKNVIVSMKNLKQCS
jgi:GAF domain-containing protein